MKTRHLPQLPLEIAGKTVGPGERRRIALPVASLPTQGQLTMTVEAICGRESGPRLFLCAAIHGDELNGIEIIRIILEHVNPKNLRGALVVVPVVNIFGFLNQSRWLPDRRDLNRSFPGSKKGSLASRMAHLFMNEVVAHCTHGIDLHTGSASRNNMPQVRADLTSPETLRLAEAFSAPVIVHSALRDGSLREAATEAGLHMLVYEGGASSRFNAEAIACGAEGVLSVMDALGMFSGKSAVPVLKIPGREKHSRRIRPTIFGKATWIRARRSGLFRASVSLGERVEKSQVLGEVADAFGERCADVRAASEGVVIGLQENPIVNRGDALIHLAVTGLDGSD
jgi:predicted deacylase